MVFSILMECGIFTILEHFCFAAGFFESVLTSCFYCRDGWEAKALLDYYEAKEQAKTRRGREPPLLVTPRRPLPPVSTTSSYSQRRKQSRSSNRKR